MKTLFFILLLGFLCRPGCAQEDAPASGSAEASRANDPKPLLLPEFLWTGAWESRHNLQNRFDFRLTIPLANLALRFEVLDRRPASDFSVFRESFGGETGDKAITQPGLALYHLSTGSRLLYGVLDTYGLPARIRNIWIRGAPYAQARSESSAELKISPSSTAVSQAYAGIESKNISLGQGKIRGFAAFAVNDDTENRAPSFNAGMGYERGKGEFNLEGYFTEQTLPERKSSTWFNVRPALPPRDSRLFAGSASFSVPAFGIASDLAYSETFAFGKDYYGSLGFRFGNKPWRLSLAFDAAGSRYVDSAGGNPGAGFRSAARLERWGKKSGLFRLTGLFRGPGPEEGLLEALGKGDFSGIGESFNRISGELYYRFPANSALFGLTRFSFFTERDSRNEHKILDSGRIMAAFKLGPVNSVSEGRITLINCNKSIGIDQTGYEFDSFKLSQSLTWTFYGPFTRKNTDETEKSGKFSGLGGVKSPVNGKKGSFSILFSARAGYEKINNKDGIWDTSISASFRTRKNRLTIKAATGTFPEKWEYTISWRMQF